MEAAKALGCPYHVGIIHSHESFYHEENDAESAYWSHKGALGADMESACMLVLANLMGIRACIATMTTVLENLKEQLLGEARTKSEEDLCRAVLEGFVIFDREHTVK